MALKIKKGAEPAVAIDMTPMIDIVFQLLSFFIFTLRILTQEGDLSIQMPLGDAPGQPTMTTPPPLEIRLTSAADGSLAEIRLNRQLVNDMSALRARVEELIGGKHLAAAELEADLHCDEGLLYQHTIDAITAFTGRRDEKGHIEPLIRKVRFK